MGIGHLAQLLDLSASPPGLSEPSLPFCLVDFLLYPVTDVLVGDQLPSFGTRQQHPYLLIDFHICES
jgi:hypothetical protein